MNFIFGTCKICYFKILIEFLSLTLSFSVCDLRNKEVQKDGFLVHYTVTRRKENAAVRALMHSPDSYTLTHLCYD